MADELTLVLKVDEPSDFEVSNEVAVEKGTIMQLTNTASGRAVISTGNGDVFAGITRREKIATDGRTRMALFRRGKFRIKAHGGSSISAGNWVSTSGPNTIKEATGSELDEGKGVGIALEDIAISTYGEVFVGGY